MKRILITGMSGSGKSAAIAELDRRGYRAVDLGTSEWSHWVDSASDDSLTPGERQDWVWQEDRVRALLTQDAEGPLFVSGCAENMVRLYDVIDTIILLSAPRDTLLERLHSRCGDGYGQTPEEQRKVVELIDMVEPLLRESAHFEIDTQKTAGATTDEILAKALSSSNTQS